MVQKKYAKQLLPLMGGVAMLFLLITMMGCSKEIAVADTLEVDDLTPVARAAAGAISLDITSNATWKVGNIEASWLNVENEMGTGNDQLHLSLDENSTVEPRTASFFIVTTKDGKYHKIELTQLATDPFIELEDQELEVGSRPRSHEVQLNTNIPANGISIEILYEQEEGENWLVGLSVEQDALQFQTALNALEEERKATIILSYENTSSEDIEDVWDRITVTQMASGEDGPPEVVDFRYVQELPLDEIDENISITGNIVSTGVSDNFRRNTYIIQDENSMALAFEGIENLSLHKYNEVNLLLDGARIETFEDGDVEYRVIRGISAANILTNEADASFSPQTMYINELTDDHLLSLVTLKDVEFAIAYGGYTNFHEFYVTEPYADYATRHFPAPIRDIQGNNIFLITNKEVSYRRESVPKGSGTITGLVVKIMDSAYGDLGDYAIRHLEESDIAIDPNQANGFSEILVAWEKAWTSGAFEEGVNSLPPTIGPSTATLQKDNSEGFYFSSAPANGVFLIDKYRGDNPGSGTIISRSAYNVNSWGTGSYWIMDNISTEGITTSLSLQIEANSSTNNGPRDFAVEYSVDGENWIGVTTYQLIGQIAADVERDVVAGYKMYTYKLPDELLNKPNISIRLMNINNTAVNGSSTAIPGGTSRLGHFSIKYNK